MYVATLSTGLSQYPISDDYFDQVNPFSATKHLLFLSRMHNCIWGVLFSPQIITHAAPQCGHVKVAGATSHQKAFLKKAIALLKVIFYCYWNLNKTMLWINKLWIFYVWCHSSKSQYCILLLLCLGLALQYIHVYLFLVRHSRLNDHMHWCINVLWVF